MKQKIILAFLLCIVIPTVSYAISVSYLATPEWVESRDDFTVNVRKLPKGRQSFSITWKLGDRRRQIYATYFLCDNSCKTVAVTRTTSFSLGGVHTFYFEVAPEHATCSSVVLSEQPFSGTGNLRRSGPGGADYNFKFARFITSDTTNHYAPKPKKEPRP